MDSGTITALLAIGMIIFIGFLGNLVFIRYRIPDVLILIIVGMVIGPDILGNRFGIVTDATLSNIDEFKNLFLSVALVIILFDGGLTLDIRSVTESMRLSVVMSTMIFLLSLTFVGLALTMIMKMDLLVSLCLGAIVGGTSSAIVLPIVNKMRIQPKTKAMLAMESVFTDVLVIVGALTILSIMTLGQLDMVNITKDIASKFLVGGIVGFVAGIAWLFVLQRLQNQSYSYMITIAALFIMTALIELPPLSSSGAVAALAFGLAIGNRESINKRLKSNSLALESNRDIQRFHNEITFFVRSFFFVYLGMFFRFGTFTYVHFVAGLLMISMVVLVRWVMTLFIGRVGKLPFTDTMAIFSLMPRGLAAAVLATLPAITLYGTVYWNEELGPLFLNTTLIVIFGTTVLTTIFSFATEKRISGKDRKERLDKLYSDASKKIEEPISDAPQ